MTVFCRMQFLKTLTTQVNLDFFDEEAFDKVKTKWNLLDFLLNGATVKTDLKAEDIEKDLANPFVKTLMKKGRLQPAKEYFDLLDEKNSNGFFLGIDNYSSFVILDEVCEKKSQEFEDNYGYHCISNENKFSVLFDEKLKSFRRGEKVSWEFAHQFLKPHNSIVIADPYLFKPESLRSVTELVRTITSRTLKGQYFLTLVGTSNKLKNDERFTTKEIDNFKSELKSFFPNVELIIEYHFCNILDFHDRYIITNNTCVFSGYSFDLIENQTARKETTWVAFKPFKRISIDDRQGVFFYKIMQDKLKEIRRWIDRNGQTQILNPLLITKR